MTYNAVGCPSCDGPLSKVVGSTSRRGDYRRTRECLKCQRTFTTYEISSQDHRVLATLRAWVGNGFSKRQRTGK